MIKIILSILFLTTPLFAMKDTKMNTLISHAPNTPFDLAATEARLKSEENLTLPLDETLSLLKDMTQFELGNFLLKNKGLNGYWTSYIILRAPKKTDLSPLEAWVVNNAPAVKATQERFHIFQKEIQARLKSSMTLASAPCGLMDDLLGLDFSGCKDITLVGLDLDQKTLELAKDNAKRKRIAFAKFVKKDAWDLGHDERYELLTSNGLNIYEPNDRRVISLYKGFHKVLKPNGVLITSFLTPPEAWKDVDTQDALKQKAIFGDIIQAGWQSFRTEAETREQLKKAGFKMVKFIYDSKGMFPTVIATKS